MLRDQFLMSKSPDDGAGEWFDLLDRTALIGRIGQR
jgi:hypothetical protein